MSPRQLTLLVLAFFLLIAGWATPTRVYGQAPPRAIVLAWDGASSAFVHDLLRQGKLPNLAKLIEGGAFAESVLPVFPSKTAPGFATLWTGAPPQKTGISGNRVPREPRAEHTILESISAFAAAPLLAEPIWSVAERAGKKVVLSHVPFAREKSERAVKFQGYNALPGRDGVVTGRKTKPQRATSWSNLPESKAPPLEISFTIGSSTIFGLFIDDPADGQNGYDTLALTGKRDGRDLKAKLKSAPPAPNGAFFWSGAIEVKTAKRQSAESYLRLFDLKTDGSDFLLYFTRPARDRVSHPELLAGAGRAIGAFVGNGASLLYNRGELGVPLAKGGDGVAEARYLETVQFAQHQLMDTNGWVLEHISWDLFLAYTPFPDEAEHLWRGYLDPNLPAFRKELATQLLPFMERVYRSCDEILGLFMAHRRENTIIALVSDHGAEGVHKRLAINQLLQQAGLLHADEQGRVDPAKTKLFYPPINNGYLLINSSDRKSGIVPQEERSALLKRFRELASEIRDGEKQLVTALYDARVDGDKLGIGGEAGGDIYLDILPGYDFESRMGTGDTMLLREPYGMHGFNPRRPSMHTIMALNGPGIAAGKRLRDVRLLDFAPTLAKLLGLSSPTDATGRVLHEAFTHPY